MFPVAFGMITRALSVPQMQDGGAEATGLDPDAGVDQADRQIRVLEAPARDLFVEAVGSLEIGAPGATGRKLAVQ